MLLSYVVIWVLGLNPGHRGSKGHTPGPFRPYLVNRQIDLNTQKNYGKHKQEHGNVNKYKEQEIEIMSQ